MSYSLTHALGENENEHATVKTKDPFLILLHRRHLAGHQTGASYQGAQQLFDNPPPPIAQIFVFLS